MSMIQAARQTCWLVHKDLLRERRAPRAWPAMLLLGCILVTLLDLQIDLPAALQQIVVAGLLWMALFFAGTLALDRSFSGEREDGCWSMLQMFPMAPGTLYAAKLLANWLALAGLELVLVPLFAVLTDAPLGAHPAALAATLLLANVGFAALGTVMSALTNGLSRQTGLLALLLLPLLTPLVLGAAEATRMSLAAQLGRPWWLWIQLIGCFAALFTCVGALVFPYLLEE